MRPQVSLGRTRREPSRSRSPRHGVRHLLATFLTAAPVAVMLVMIVPTPSPASAAASCPTGPLTFNATFSNGTASIGTAAKGSGLSGTACGALKPVLGGFTLDVPAANISFAPTTLKLFGIISVPSTITVDGPMTGTVTGPTSNPAGTLSFEQTSAAPLTSTVKLLGFTCSVGPFTPVLTTGTSGSLTGTPLTGTLTAQTGTLVSNTFSVPAIQGSPTCPGFIAGLSNSTLGLPLAPGKSSLTLPVSLTVTL